MGTEFVEHFFGLARQLLPNFTFAELIKMVKHIMLRQRILLSGKFSEKRERDSRSGYSFDFDCTPLTPEELRRARVSISVHEINQLVEIGYKEASQICKTILHMPVPNLPLKLDPLAAMGRTKTSASTAKNDSDSEDSDGDDSDDDSTEPEDSGDHLDLAETTAAAALDVHRYSQISEACEQAAAELGAVMASQEDIPHVNQPSPPTSTVAPPAPATHSEPVHFESRLLDNGGKLSVDRMLSLRRRNQALTSTRSERVVDVDSKFAIVTPIPAQNESAPQKISIQKASQLLRVAQERDVDINAKKSRKARELMWKSAAKSISTIVSPSGEQI